MPSGQKHLIQCRCVLPQLKRSVVPIFHSFVVFSIIDDDGTVRPKLAQCNNCGVLHRVIDLCKSEFVKKDHSTSLLSIDDVRSSFPEQLESSLSAADVDLPTWEQAKFIYENELWGQHVILSSESDGELRHVKLVRILGRSLFKVEQVSTTEVISG